MTKTEIHITHTLCLWKGFSTHPGYPYHYAYEKASTHPGHSGSLLFATPSRTYERCSVSLLPILFACEINIKFNSMFFFFDENILYFFFFLQVWLAVLLCRHTPMYYDRIVVKPLYTPAPIKNCAELKNVCIHQCVQICVYMYIMRTRFYANFYIVSKRKHNAQFSLKGLKKMFQCKKKCSLQI